MSRPPTAPPIPRAERWNLSVRKWIKPTQTVGRERIRGLFASGNTTSGRFGRDYFTPLVGVSICMAVCLGRECGRSIGKQIRGEIFYPDEIE